MTDTNIHPVSKSDTPNFWGMIDHVMNEFTHTVSLLNACDKQPEAFRAFTRWFFDALGTVAFALKGLARTYAERTGTTVSTRESQILQIIEEPRFPGLPPPRRREEPLRESLNTAIRVFARARNAAPPLPEGKLPDFFIEATGTLDRISRPASVDDLQIIRADLVSVGRSVIWFRELHKWLMEQRRAELDELKEELARTTAAMIQKLKDEAQG